MRLRRFFERACSIFYGEYAEIKMAGGYSIFTALLR